MHEKVLLLKSPQNTKRHQILLSLREKENNKCEIYQDKVIHFTNEPSMWRSFVKNTFVDDGDIQLVTNRFDRNTYCTVPHWSLSSKEFQFTTKNLQNALLHEMSDLKFWNFKLSFLRIYFSSVANFFQKIWLSLFILNRFQ